MKKISIFVLMSLLLSVLTHAQPDNLQVAYNTVYTHKFNAANEQLFAEFSAKKGEVVYLQAQYEGFVIASIDLDLRDESGRSIGLKENYLLEDYVIATIPQDGNYVAVITAEDAETVSFEIGLSGYINDGIDASLTNDGFRKIYMVNVPSDGDYIIDYKRISGNLDVNFIIVNMSSMFTETILDVSGIGLDSWSSTFGLNVRDRYLIFLDKEFISFGSGVSAEITVKFNSAD